jgi:hypothetical protein
MNHYVVGGFLALTSYYYYRGFLEFQHRREQNAAYKEKKTEFLSLLEKIESGNDDRNYWENRENAFQMLLKLSSSDKIPMDREYWRVNGVACGRLYQINLRNSVLNCK